MKYKLSNPLLRPATLATSVLLANSALASVVSLEEIVVTAQKREQSLQDVPIAISAIDSELLQANGVSTAADVGEMVPNVTITAQPSSSFNIRMNIRGNGTAEPSLAIDPKVGLYIDGVYIARNAGAVFDLVDMERVEVMRGPQGSLWGKNTTGGALNITTQRPSGENVLNLKVGAGNYGLRTGQLSWDTPEVNGLSAKLSYMNKSYDGWQDNVNMASDAHFGDIQAEAFRAAVNWDINDSLNLYYIYDRTDAASTPEAMQAGYVSAGSQGAATITDIRSGIPQTYIYTNPSDNPFAQLADTVSDKRRETFDADFMNSEKLDVEGHNLTLSWYGDNIQLKSITSYREYNSHLEGLDVDAITVEGGDGLLYGIGGVTPAALPTAGILHTSGSKDHEQFSQELQLIGDAFNEKLDYVLGLYYFDEKGNETTPWELTSYSAASNSLVILPYGNWYEVTSESKAAFGQLTYYFNDSWNLTYGFRYTEDKKSLLIPDEDPIITQDAKFDKAWEKFTSSVTLNYAINDDISTYAKIAEGYASGIYNPGTLNRGAALAGGSQEDILYSVANPTDPEELISYELGIKSKWFDNRVVFNAAAFYNEADNLIVSNFDGTSRVAANSGTADTQGIELEVQTMLTDNLRVDAAYGYLDIDYSDSTRIQREARNTGSLGVFYSFDGVDNGELVAFLGMTYTGKEYFDVRDRSISTGDSRTLYNGRLSWNDISIGGSMINVGLWGKNLTDEEYIYYGYSIGEASMYAYGAPRTVGLDVSIEF
ncbi:TonB-dependent receptor [Aestuariicella hydrocarbonica]|uniref:TonB-dependent receptor n=1 Tax=Pseudomaricurvus hydrocarbonicus TaxID=1470433 RepID=A0A9E5MKY6_9GAMM|nr:TonB-dependent receptor [Aestuariicella hydrocarbonica]NHO66052.1 TonB-dependent receptor [Aestuariicella hydrocarbonica]